MQRCRRALFADSGKEGGLHHRLDNASERGQDAVLTAATYNPTLLFWPKDEVVCHCCQSLQIVAAESLLIFGIGGI